jgi:hypothetical protein
MHAGGCVGLDRVGRVPVVILVITIVLIIVRIVLVVEPDRRS